MMKYVYRIGIYLFGFVVAFYIIQMTMIPKNHSLLTMNDFYDLEKDSVDTLFIGGSHIVNGLEPEVIEEITGRVATSCAIIGQTAPLHIAYLQEVLGYQHPQLLIVDIYRFKVNAYSNPPLPDLHESINGLRFGGVKLHSILENADRDDIWEFIFPIIRYHDRWKSLIKEDIKYLAGKRMSSNKGYSGTDVVQPQNIPVAKVTKEVELPGKTKELLNTLIGYAKKEDISVLFVNWPYAHLNDNDMNMYQAIVSYLNDVSKEQSVRFEYLDYNQMTDEIHLDFQEDFRDYSHLNNAGARKVSVHLGNYIKEYYYSHVYGK